MAKDDQNPMTVRELLGMAVTMTGPMGEGELLRQYERRVEVNAINIRLINLLRFQRIAGAKVYKTTVIGTEVVQATFDDGCVGTKLKLRLKSNNPKYSDEPTTGFFQKKHPDGTLEVTNQALKDKATAWFNLTGHDVIVVTYTVMNDTGSENLGKDLLHLVDLGETRTPTD